jgi:hypothetical protein
VPYLDVVPCGTAARQSGGKRAAGTLQARLHAGGVLEEDFLCLFTSANVLQRGLLIDIFYLALFLPYLSMS